jgi:hypothetical protein
LIPVAFTFAVVDPLGMVTVDGDSVSLDASVVKVTTVPAAGAGKESVIFTSTDCHSCRLVLLAERVRVPGGVTVTEDVTSAIPAELALIVVVPGPTGVTLNPIDFVPAVSRIDEGTVATLGLLEVSVNVVLLGAGLDSVIVSVPSPAICRVRVDGARVAVRPTVTNDVAVACPADFAEMVVVPVATPVMLTARLG